MDFLVKFMVLSLVLVSAYSHFNSSEEGFISAVISQKGLNFVKDLLIEYGVSTIVPLRLPNIEKTANIILIGKVHLVLSDLIIDSLDVNSSDIQIVDSGVSIVVTKATANIRMKWQYTYKTWLITISDEGDASVQVDGMTIGLNLSLDQQNGSLALSLLDCRCNVEDISIHLHGGASWLYQVVVDALEGVIESNVQDNISKKIEEGVVKLDSSLRSLPLEIPIANVAALNVTFVGNPVFYSSSIELKINGLFNSLNKNLSSGYYYDETEDFLYHGDNSAERIETFMKEDSINSVSPVLFKNYRDETEHSVYCNGSAKMIEISLHENVLSSASQVLFKENYIHWIVDEIPHGQRLLNTAAWRFIIPRLYRQYPNDDMVLNISASSPPVFKLGDEYINASFSIDIIINVLDFGEVISVACISSEITATISPKIMGKDLVGLVSLENFDLSLKWSKIGRLHLRLIQKTISGLIKTLLMPADFFLLRGITLPSFHGLFFQNAETLFNSSRIIMCSDIGFDHEI